MAFAHHEAVVAHEHLGARSPRDGSRVVGAVVRDHVDVHQFRGVVLLFDTGDQLADDGLLVATCHEHGVATQRLVVFLRQAAVVGHEHDYGVDHLVHVAKAEEEEEQEVECVDEVRHIVSMPLAMRKGMSPICLRTSGGYCNPRKYRVCEGFLSA